MRDRSGILEKTRKEYLSLANEVLGAFDCNPKNDSDIQVAVNDLIRNYEEVEQAERKRAILEREMAASSEMIEQLRGRISDLNSEITDLLGQGGADNEEQFRERAYIYGIRTELER